MRKLFLIMALAGLVTAPAMAQDDDLYFTPSKTTKSDKAVDETPAYYRGSNRPVDEYNRRGQFRSMYQTLGSDSLTSDIIRFVPGVGVYPDTTYVDSTRTYYSAPGYSGDDDYYYTRRMSRWDGFYDPWFYGYYGPWYWRSGWYDPWYYGYYGWYDPWYYDYAWGWGGWYDPWYYGYYGWGYPWRYGWGGYWGPYWGGGYATVRGGHNSGGYSGWRTYSGRDIARGNAGSGSGVFGRGGRGSSTGYRGNTYTRGSASNRSFGGRTDYNRTYTPSNNSSFGTRSSSFGGGSFGGGHTGGGGGGGSFGGGGFGGGHTGGGGGGGHFGGGHR